MEQEFRDIYSKWLQEEERDATAAGAPSAGADTPIAFVSQDLPATQIGVDSDSSIPQAGGPVSSPTPSVSTTSDLAPSELGEDPVEGSDEQASTVTHHEKFYLKDGDLEIICEDTVFRVHSSIISFSSPRLRDMLSKYILSTPMLQGYPTVVFEDTAEDFAILLKMIYTPG